MAKTRDTARDHVVTYVREALLAGELNSCQHLVESELASKLGISRTPVREAFARLEELGIVTRTPYKGCRINDFNPRQLSDIYDIRRVLEPVAAEKAAPHIEEDDIVKLEDIHRRMKECIDDVDRYHALDTEFHLELYRKCGNNELCKLINELRFKIGFLQHTRWYYRAIRVDSIKQHRAMIKALKNGSGDIACLVRQHIDYAKRGE